MSEFWWIVLNVLIIIAIVVVIEWIAYTSAQSVVNRKTKDIEIRLSALESREWARSAKDDETRDEEFKELREYYDTHDTSDTMEQGEWVDGPDPHK